MAGTDGGARSIHVTAKGTITHVEDIRPADLAAFNQDPESWHQATEARQAALVKQQARESEVVTATVEKPERVTCCLSSGRAGSLYPHLKGTAAHLDPEVGPT